MKLEQTFTVDAPIEAVWEALIDIERVAPCLPGAQITERDDDGTYKGTFTVKLGPTTAAYNGSLKFDSLDADAHVATMSARGTDKRGQGGANATIVSSVAVADEGGSKVDVVTDFTITGKLARFGRSGMIEDISNRLLKDFATCLQSKIVVTQPAEPEPPPATGDAPAAPVAPPPPAAPPAPAKPISGLSLFLGALLDRIKRLFKRS